MNPHPIPALPRAQAATAAAVAAIEPTCITLDGDGCAQLIGVSARTWRRMVQHGKTPEPVRLSSKTVVWSRAEIVAWFEAKCPPRDKWKYKAKAS